MSWAHLHLMMNHLPVLGAPFLLALLAWGLWHRSRELVRSVLGATILLAAISETVFLTGEPAEEQLKSRPGFSEQLVERHEERAEVANIAMIVTGVVAAVALWRGRREPAPAGLLPRVVLLALAVNTGLYAVTAWTGGPIGHPELRAGTGAGAAPAPPSRTANAER